MHVEQDEQRRCSFALVGVFRGVCGTCSVVRQVVSRLPSATMTSAAPCHAGRSVLPVLDDGQRYMRVGQVDRDDLIQES